MNSIDNDVARAPDDDLVAALLIESLHTGNSPTLTVISNSMRPLLNTGDQVVLVSADLETLKKGDIITVKSKEGFLTHRVVSCSNREIRTKGDRNDIFDPPFQPNQMIGRIQKINAKRSGKIINLDGDWEKRIGNLIYRLSIIEFFFTQFFKRNHAAQRNYHRFISVTFTAVMRLLVKTL